MKIKLFSNVFLAQLEDEVNRFMQDAGIEVHDVRMTGDVGDITVMVVYAERGTGTEV